MLLGTFIKTPVSHPVEILGAVGFDFVVLDQDIMRVPDALLPATNVLSTWVGGKKVYERKHP